MVELKVVIQSLEEAAGGKAIVKNVIPTVVIQSLEEAAGGKAIVENVIPTKAKGMTVGILEGGMESGATSLMFIVETEKGEHHFAEVSVNLFEGLAGAVAGAKERFGGK